MSTEQTPRTWTVECENYAWHVRAGVGHHHYPKQAPPVEVIEADPVLDLAESQLDFLETVTQWTGVDLRARCERKDDLETLLRRHGRLQPSDTGDER